MSIAFFRCDMTPAQDQHSLPQLFSDLTHETSELFRKEIELAKLEIGDNLSNLKTGAASMAAAIALLFAGLLVLLSAAVLAVDRALQMPLLSALIVGLAVVLAGVIALISGRNQAKNTVIKPRRTVESLRDDKRMLERHAG